MKPRYTRYTLAAVILSSMALSTGCQKSTPNELSGIPDDALMLHAESYTSNNKTSVNGSSVQWDGAETVNLNGVDYTVVVNDNKAYADDASALASANTIYGYYGCENVSNGQTTAPTVTIPASYTCSIDGNGRQIIPLPMAAYRDGVGESVEFKHLTAAVNVTIWNATANTLYVDSVVVMTDSYRINGDLALTLTVANYGISTDNSSVPENNRKVKVTFSTPMEISCGESNAKSVQVPIMPIGDDEMTIKVYSHNADIEGVPISGLTHTYNHEASSVALGRNVMLTAKVKMDPKNTHVNSKGVFSVSENDVVYFSQGNLQWSGVNGWRFALHQYDYIGSAANNNNPTASDANYMDLFCWGATGLNGVDPNTDADFLESNDNLSGDNDWGSVNITNASDGWRTLSQAEWNYLFKTRSCSTVNGTSNARFAKGKVNDVYGVILFPDNYNHPAGVTVPLGINENGTTGWNGNNYNTTDWSKMETAGAIFLPAAGSRYASSFFGSQGKYWSSTSFGTDAAYIVRILAGALSTNFDNGSADGNSVRLVHN